MIKVLVDTSVWSLAFRRKEPDMVLRKLTELILASQIIMIGPVRQELLSGISNEKTYNELKSRLRAFNDFAISSFDYETAAQFFNICRKHGIQGSHIDFLICAVTYNNGFHIFTTDNDFVNYSKHIPLKLVKEESQ